MPDRGGTPPSVPHASQSRFAAQSQAVKYDLPRKIVSAVRIGGTLSFGPARWHEAPHGAGDDGWVDRRVKRVGQAKATKHLILQLHVPVDVPATVSERSRAR